MKNSIYDAVLIGFLVEEKDYKDASNILTKIINDNEFRKRLRLKKEMRISTDYLF